MINAKDLSCQCKATIVVSCVRSVLLHGAVGRAFSKRDLTTLGGEERRMARWLFGLNLRTMKRKKIKDRALYKCMRLNSLAGEIRVQRLRFLGHLLRHPDHRSSRALFGVFCAGVKKDKRVLLEADYGAQRTVLQEYLETWRSTTLPKRYIRFFHGRDTPEHRKLWHNLVQAVRAREAAKYWHPHDTGAAEEAEAQLLKKSRTDQNVERMAEHIRALAEFDPQVEKAPGFQGAQEVKAAKLRRQRRKMTILKKEISETGITAIVREEVALNKRRPGVLHKNFVYSCSACQAQFQTGAAELPSEALNHAKAHGRELITIWSKDQALYADCFTATGSRLDARPYRPWLIRANKFTFVRQIVPEQNATISGQNGNTLRCRNYACNFRLSIPQGIQQRGLRKTFYNSLRKHELKCDKK